MCPVPYLKNFDHLQNLPFPVIFELPFFPFFFGHDILVVSLWIKRPQILSAYTTIKFQPRPKMAQHLRVFHRLPGAQIAARRYTTMSNVGLRRNQFRIFQPSQRADSE